MSRVLDLLYPAHGQCRLTYVSATQIKLAPHNGQNLNIAGTVEQIPAAGVTISNSGLSNSTLYYVYAYMNAGTMTLELSATGHSQHTNGVETKTGDTTRTLVGMIRTNGSGEFADSASIRTVASWFNRRRIYSVTATLSDQTANTAFEELTGGSASFLSWAGEGVEIDIVGYVKNSAAGNNINTTSAAIDGSTSGAQTIATTYAADVDLPAYARAIVYPAEGHHLAAAFGKVSAGTGTWSYGIQVATAG